VLAAIHTCGKALAAAGAFVCGAEHLRDFLINRARTFIFSTGLPPYFAAQVGAGLRMARQSDAQRTHLSSLGMYLRDELNRNGFDTAGSSSHIVPVILGANDATVNFAAYLQARGFGVKAIRPPTVPQNSSRVRLSLTANLTKETLAELASTMVQARAEQLPERPERLVPTSL
jgi:8-amino-7-oxononanoate synthase